MISNPQVSPVIIAYDNIIKMIADGRLKPGMHLPTIDLAKSFGMSRTPVIEALKKLENEDVVVFRSGNGAWLANPTTNEVRDLYFLRKELEVLALKLSIDNIKSTDLIEMRKYSYLEIEYINLGDKVSTFKAGLDFHKELHSHCTNKYLVNCINRTLSTIFAYLVMLDQTVSESDKTHPEDHGILLDYITAKENTKAIDFLGKHIDLAFHIDIPQ